jgi:hypothetical protein
MYGQVLAVKLRKHRFRPKKALFVIFHLLQKSRIPDIRLYISEHFG